MKPIITILICFLINSAFAQSKIMDCTVQPNSGNSDLYVYLTDTLSVTGFNIKIGSQYDGSDLFNQEYDKVTLPADASLGYNTLYLPLGNLGFAGEMFAWIKVLLTGGGYHEIKVSMSN